MAYGVLAFTFTLILLLIAVYLWWETQSLQEQTGMPTGKVIYSDTGVWRKQTESLYAQDVGLVGKPDYLIQADGGIVIPVEVKSGQAPPRQPYDSHIMQLAAYCYLVEENYGIRPPYGVVRYKDSEFQVEYSAELEHTLLDTLSYMREDMYAPSVNRSHQHRARCNSCGVRDVCDQRLA